ncbi:MAG: sigma factor-like helix-turn-helix DNA-binding protein, partial [Nocardioidaceae bacterium]
AETRRDIANPRAYLIRITVNESLRRLGRAHRRHESYVGPWLPEPLVTDSEPDATDPIVRADEVSMAMLVVLETLAPLERAVFILRETFGYEHAEIAAIIGRSPAAVRQLAHRAREHVRERRPRFDAQPEVRRAVTEKFLSAALGGDLEALLEVLAPDVTLWTDGGGVAPAARRVITGSDKVGRLLNGFVTTGRIPDVEFRQVEVNGDPGILLRNGDGTPYGIIVVELTPEGDRVRDIYGIVNPDKLRGVR